MSLSLIIASAEGSKRQAIQSSAELTLKNLTEMSSCEKVSLYSFDVFRSAAFRQNENGFFGDERSFNVVVLALISNTVDAVHVLL